MQCQKTHEVLGFQHERRGLVIFLTTHMGGVIGSFCLFPFFLRFCEAPEGLLTMWNRMHPGHEVRFESTMPCVFFWFVIIGR